MKTHTLKFKGYHGRPKKIAEIRDLNEAGQPKSDQDILDEAFFADSCVLRRAQFQNLLHPYLESQRRHHF